MEVIVKIQLNFLQVVLDGHLMVNAAKIQDSCLQIVKNPAMHAIEFFVLLQGEIKLCL